MCGIGAIPVCPASWYYILATCDMDSQAATNSNYFTSSFDSSIQVINEGQ